MATEVLANQCTVLSATTTLTELRLYTTWLVVWSAEGNLVYLVTGDAEEGAAVPVASRRIPPGALPFPIDVSPYDGRVFLAASAPCTVVLEARE
jgi:hypothetical protein